MTKKEKKRLLEQFIERAKRIDAYYEKTADALGISSSEVGLFAEVFKMRDEYMAMVSEKLGDDFDSLSWFVYENDYGSKRMEAGTKKRMRKIATVDDLLWLITASAKG